eukprot:SAG31_NODE_18252_length_642_cov_0.937385_2_plen_60_part_00
MTCEEDMVEQANMIKAADPSKRVWVYRNIVSWKRKKARWFGGSPMYIAYDRHVYIIGDR